MLLLMDLDGVLIDCRNAVFRAYRKGFDRVGLCLERSTFEEVMDGLHWPESAKAVFPGISEGDLAGVRRAKDELFVSELQSHPGKVDKVACAWVRAFKKMDCEIWLVTAGSRDSTHIKIKMLPEDIQEAFSQILTGIDKTGDAFYGLLRRHSRTRELMVLVDDDPRVWQAARNRLVEVTVVEWGT